MHERVSYFLCWLILWTNYVLNVDRSEFARIEVLFYQCIQKFGSFLKRLFSPYTVLSLDPVIGAIAAGNTVVLKPSEIAPATSSMLAKLLEEYMDNSAIRVVEGAVAETSALLEQKWDKIFYTGYYLP